MIAVRIEDEVELCNVVFLPGRVFLSEGDCYAGKNAQVIKIHEDDEELVYKNDTKMHNDVASLRFIMNVVEYE